MDTMAEVLDEKGRSVHTTQPDASVREAVAVMCSSKVGSLLVCDGTRPVGLFTERDLKSRVVLRKRDPDATYVYEVMTPEVPCLGLEATVHEAMQVMTEQRCRYVPIVGAGRVIGMVSIGDLVEWMCRNQQNEIHLLREYIGGLRRCGQADGTDPTSPSR